MLSLILLLFPRAAQAQTFSNVQGNAYRTTGSGSGTGFGALISSQINVNGALDPTYGGGVSFNTNASNFGLPHGTPFAIRWTGSFYAPYSGTYTFNVTADDGFRLYLNNGGTQVGYFGNWNESSPTQRTYQVMLAANTTYAFTLEYYENGVSGGQISLGAAAPPAPPSTPLGLSGSAYYGNMVLGWTSDPVASFYTVYRRKQGTTNDEYLGSPTTPSFTDTTGDPGANYLYSVQAYNGTGVGPQSSALLLYPTLPAPTRLTATANPYQGGIDLRWDSFDGATSWTIYRAAAGSGYSIYTYASTNSYLDTGYNSNPATVPGTTYYYQVVAGYRTGKQSAPSNPANAVFPYPAPGKPLNLAATPGSGQVTLTWTAPPSPVSKYQIAYSQNNTTQTFTIPAPAPTATSGTLDNVLGPYVISGSSINFTVPVTGLSNRTNYYFQVRAVNDAGTGPPTATVGATPDVPDDALVVSSTFPSAMTAGQSYTGTIVMRNIGTAPWTTLTPDSSQGYYLSFADGKVPFTWGLGAVRFAEPGPIARNGTATFTFTVTAPTTPNTYPFLWRMVHQNINFLGDGTTGSVAVAPSVPSPPTGLTATRGDGQASLSWTAPTGAVASYNVKRSLNPGGPYTTVVPVGTVKTASFTDTGLSNQTSYYYVVSAVNASGESANSNEAGVTPSASDDALYVSQSVPATMTAGQSYTVSVTMKNIGTATWPVSTPGSGYFLGAANPGGNTTWNNPHYVAVSQETPPGASRAFTFTITAPATPGTYNFQRQMFHWGYPFFGDLTPNIAVNVVAPSVDGADFVSQSVPTTMIAGQTYTATVTMVNTGTTTWPVSGYNPALNSNAGCLLADVTGPGVLDGTWRTPSYTFSNKGTPPGATQTFAMTLTAPQPQPKNQAPYTFQAQMNRWGNPWFGVVTPSVSINVLPTLSLMGNLVWTSDATTSPATQKASSGGTFGGNATVHLSLFGPSNLSSPTVTNLTIHEDAGNSPDLVFSNLAMTGYPSAVCLEPAENPVSYSSAYYIDLPWPAGGHNGSYTMTATVSAVVNGVAQTITLKNGGSLLSQGRPVSFDREDLLITDTMPVNPAPLLWDPTNPTLPNPAPLSATFTAAYKANGTATVKIYHSYDNINPVRTLTAPILTSDGKVSLSWDGNSDPATGSVSQDPGVYLFQWSLSDTTGSTDSDKSTFPSQAAGLQVPNPPSPIADYDPNDVSMRTYLFAYKLLSLDNPTRSASSGQVDAYDIDFVDKATRTLVAGELAPGLHTVQVVTPQEDDYIFLVSPLDGDSDKDKAHRNRYALQHNQSAPGVPRGALFGTSDALPDTLTNVWDILHNQGIWQNNRRIVLVYPAPQLTVTRYPVSDPNYNKFVAEPRIDQSAAQAWYALKYSSKSKGPLYWFFLGHGSSGNALHFGGNTWLVADRANDKAPKVGQRTYVEDFANGELKNVYICVLAACTSGKSSQASGDTSRIAAMLRQKGVQNTINFNQHVPKDVAATWSEKFWKYFTQGDNSSNKSFMNARDAAAQAQDDIILSGRGTFAMTNGHNSSFVQFNGVDIISTANPLPTEP